MEGKLCEGRIGLELDLDEVLLEVLARAFPFALNRDVLRINFHLPQVEQPQLREGERVGGMAVNRENSEVDFIGQNSVLPQLVDHHGLVPGDSELFPEGVFWRAVEQKKAALQKHPVIAQIIRRLFLNLLIFWLTFSRPDLLDEQLRPLRQDTLLLLHQYVVLASDVGLGQVRVHEFAGSAFLGRVSVRPLEQRDFGGLVVCEVLLALIMNEAQNRVLSDVLTDFQSALLFPHLHRAHWVVGEH